MTSHPTTQVLLMALLLGATALATGTSTTAATAGILASGLGAAPPHVVFSTAPHWETVPGTRVALVSADQRPTYDLFRYGSKYYVYDGGNWYRSSRVNGRYIAVDERRVPVAIAGVPNDRWQNYPAGWNNPKSPHYAGRHDNGRHMGQGRGGDKH